MEGKKDLIQIVQPPVIEYWLQEQKAEINRKVERACALVCTEETVQSVKSMRTDLRKQFEDLEEVRKAVKRAVMEPYEQFEREYKECIAEPSKRADGDLKRKIEATEAEIKKRCEDGLRDYFSELCALNHVEWLTFEQTGVKVDMSTAKQKTPNKLRCALKNIVERVAQDMAVIRHMEYAEEIAVEYRSCLVLSEAVSTVNERQKRIEEEKVSSMERNKILEQEAGNVQRVEAFAPPVPVAERTQGEEFDCTFTVHTTMSKLERLKLFLKEEGIAYE